MQDVTGAMLNEPLRRIDETEDILFYRQPRFAYHVDSSGVDAITRLYRQWLPARGRILDLMSSWVSHLPPEVEYREVVGLGMNAVELAANPRLDMHVVHDLNQSPILPFIDARFDAVTISLAIDYLVYPVRVLTDLARVVVAGAPLMVIYSNRCFPTKAVMPWLNLDDRGRGAFVREILLRTGLWKVPASLDCTPSGGDALFTVIARRG
jgi:SAM-dependent methyltransferase